MLYLKKGFPQEGELVVCTAVKIHPTSVFAKLDHFENKMGVLHISEIAPGRIRNLSEYVTEGKQLVLQVLNVNLDRGHIDLSLRRVSEARRIKKFSDFKQEVKAEKIVEAVAKQCGIKTEELYHTIKDPILAKYEFLFQYFNAVVRGEDTYDLVSMLPAKQLDVLKEIVKQRIKPPLMEIAGIFKLKSYAPDGLEVVRHIITTVQKTSTAMKITYGGGGTFPFHIQGSTFQDVEETLKVAVDKFESLCTDKLTQFAYERREGKEVTE